MTAHKLKGEATVHTRWSLHVGDWVKQDGGYCKIRETCMYRIESKKRWLTHFSLTEHSLKHAIVTNYFLVVYRNGKVYRSIKLHCLPSAGVVESLQHCTSRIAGILTNYIDCHLAELHWLACWSLFRIIDSPGNQSWHHAAGYFMVCHTWFM